MKATGIVRRIDDLGRVVIPKEIRRTMRIREGDPLEIYTDSGGEVIFKKYSPVGELAVFAELYAESIVSETVFSVIICDREQCVAASGISKKEVIERKNSNMLEEIMESRKAAVFDNNENSALEGSDCKIYVAVPIISSGDISGAVVFVNNTEEMRKVSESDIKLATVAAKFLSKQMEQ